MVLKLSLTSQCHCNFTSVHGIILCTTLEAKQASENPWPQLKTLKILQKNWHFAMLFLLCHVTVFFPIFWDVVVFFCNVVLNLSCCCHHAVYFCIWAASKACPKTRFQLMQTTNNGTHFDKMTTKFIVTKNSQLWI